MEDSVISDSEDEEILQICSELKIRVPHKKSKFKQMSVSDLENIDLNNIPVIVPGIISSFPQEQVELGEELPTISTIHQPQTSDQPPQYILLEQVELGKEVPAISDTNQPQTPDQPPQPILVEQPSQPMLVDQPPQPVLVDQPREPILLNQPPSDDECQLNLSRKRMQKVLVDPKKWDKNLTKSKRLRGEEYVGYRRDKKVTGNEKFKVLHDVPRPARKLGPRCNSNFCNRSKLRGCHSLTDDERQNIFTKFWNYMSWEQRKQYVVSHVLLCEKKQVKAKTNSRRNESKQYFLSTLEGRVQVCLKTFLNTLGLKESSVRCWLTGVEHGIANTSTNTYNDDRVIKKDDLEYLKSFFSLLPKMPSHYCRASTSKQYLEPIIEDKTCLYKLYSSECTKSGRVPLSRWSMCRIFDAQNLSLFSPKKDQCDTCCAHKVGNITEDEYKAHIKKKDMARNEKVKDKERARQFGDVHVFTHDLQAVKLCPQLQASALYYKTKLCVHNFTMYNLATKDVYCYWFDESNAGLTASVFISCIINILRRTLEQNCKPIILYSDGCTAQNRNVYLSNALLHLAIEKNIVIEQKILEKGHTQMECDAVHSSIEQKVKHKEIFLPSQYASLSKEARPQKPYIVEYLNYDFFEDFTSKNRFIYDSIRPGRSSNDPTVTDLRVLQYNPDGTIKYKLNFDEDFQELPPSRSRRRALMTMPESLPSRRKLYQSAIKIAESKWKHLQELKSVIPFDCHSFYDNLPH